MQSLEAQSLHTLAEVSVEVKQLEEERTKKASAITDLEKQKREMELLVRKASMALFLREQYNHHQKAILGHLKSHPEFASSLSEIATVRKKLDALEEEIEADENVDILKSVVLSSRTTPTALDTLIESVDSPFLKFMLQGVKAYLLIIKRAFSVSVKL